MNIKGILEDMVGHEVDDFTHTTNIDIWRSWYKGTVNDFHNYYQYNGKKKVKRRRYSMQMAKRVCEDWANLLINEKTDITLSEDGATEKLAALLDRVGFWVKANQGVETAFALSMGAFVVRVDDLPIDEEGNAAGDGRLHISYINASKIYPLEWDEDGKITECAFISRICKDRYMIAAHHIDESGNYVIENCEATGKTADALTVDDSTQMRFDTGSSLPWFTILHPAIANNIDINSPYYCSIFANAIDRLKVVDLIFDSLQNEFNLGKKRIFLNARQKALDIDTGEYTPTFDTNDVAFYILPDSEDGNNPFLSDQTQVLRVKDHIAGLQNALDNLSDAVGFGTKHYKFDAQNVATATQVVSENSDMFRSIQKHEIVIRDCLIELTRAILYASATFCGEEIAPVDSEITVHFDDSIIVDKETEKASDRENVAMGVMSKAEFRAKYFGESLEDAEDAIREIEMTAIENAMAAQDAAQDALGGGNGEGDET